MTQKAIEAADYESISEAIAVHLHKLFGKTVVIPGGNGFLGRVFTGFFKHLNKTHEANIRIITVDNFVVGTNPALDHGCSVLALTHDLTTPIHLKIRGPVDFIINAAGIAAPNAYLNIPLEVLDVSYIGTRNVLELALAKNARVINFSSSECYGDPPPEHIPTPETYMGQISSTSKRGPYDCGKKILEALSHAFRVSFGADVSVVLPFNVYGYMHRRDYRVIPNFVYNALDDKPMTVYAPGTQTRTFCFYTDFLVGVLLVLLSGKEFAYNVGMQDGEIGMLDLAKTVERVFGKKELVSVIPPPPAYEQEPTRRCPDIGRVKTLGYAPAVCLETGLQRIREWLRSE